MKTREQTRLRQVKYREKQKLLESNATVTLRNAADLELEEELDKESIKDIGVTIPYK